MQISAKDLFVFQQKREITALYKSFLILLEDIQEDHLNMLDKLIASQSLDGDTISSVNYFDENKFGYLRKKILDSGNEAIRAIEKSVENFNIDFK